MNNNKFRLFVSIDMPKVFGDEMSAIQNELKKKNYFEARYTNPHQLHLTLAFLGRVEEKNIEYISKRLRTISFPCFELCLGSLGTLPSEKHIRILWIDTKGDKLKELAQQIHDVLSPIVPLEKREFLNHVTIARIKEVHDHYGLLDYIKNKQMRPLCFTVTEFILKQSILNQDGPIYSDIERIMLEN